MRPGGAVAFETATTFAPRAPVDAVGRCIAPVGVPVIDGGMTRR